MWDLVGNPEDRFSCVAAQMYKCYKYHRCIAGQLIVLVKSNDIHLVYKMLR